jgi:hypothetical protein
LKVIGVNWDILLLDMVELGFGDALSLAQTVGIIGTVVLTLYFSKRQLISKVKFSMTWMKKFARWHSSL